jgi:hypothetical protein
MEEKRYPILEEEENVGLCSEPSVAARYAVEEQFDVPMLGPSTWKEAMDDLDESEKEFDAGKCIPWEDVMSEIKDRYRLDDDVITIAAFWDMRMNPNKLKRMI